MSPLWGLVSLLGLWFRTHQRGRTSACTCPGCAGYVRRLPLRIVAQRYVDSHLACLDGWPCLLCAETRLALGDASVTTGPARLPARRGA